MSAEHNYLEINKNSWNKRTDAHLTSKFYDVEGFLAGQSSLKNIELELLGDVKGKSLLHLQCHFGQDTISLARRGAVVTGIDLSDNAIKNANELASKAGVDADFICCNVYDVPDHISTQFDIVFTSYGTISWLPDLDKWAKVISSSLKPGAKFIFVEFHPVVWMFDDNFEKVGYNYFNSGPIVETENGTYADRDASITNENVNWNHSMDEVVNSLINNGIKIESLNEYDYSPYDCFNNIEEFEPGKFRVAHFKNNIPMVFSISSIKI